MQRRATLAALFFIVSTVAGAQVDLHDQMLDAIRTGNTPKAKALLAAKLDPNTRKDTRASPTFLTYAAFHGRTEIIRMLISAGAQINTPDGDMLTPLMQASAQGHLAAVRVLITSGASLTEVSTQGETALDLAKQGNHQAVVRALQKASVETR